MAREKKDGDVSGMRLWMRFALAMTLALAVVMGIAGYLLYSRASDIATSAQDAIMVESVRLTGRFAYLQAEIDRRKAEFDSLGEALKAFSLYSGRMDDAAMAVRDGIQAQRDAKTKELEQAQHELEAFWRRVGQEETAFGGHTFRYPVTFGPQQAPGFLYRYKGREEKDYELIVPANVDLAQKGFFKLIAWSIALVVLVGAGMALFIASTVARPIADLVQDIHQISKGMLAHRAKTGQGGEVGQLSLAINKMAKSLADARETEVALSIREREVALAAEVRDALLPDAPPKVSGCDLAALHVVSLDLGGDFQDFVQLEDGRIGLLVCDVSGKGVPGAMVGGMARAYLRSELERGLDVAQSFKAINRAIARDVRKGMFVTALYALVDPAQGIATVACAGHKLPLLRISRSDGKLRVVQPEGIALGFDKGAVFDRRLEVQQIPFEPGDRLVLCNTGTVAAQNPEGAEIGEKPVYAAVLKHAARPSHELLARLRAALEAFAGGKSFPRDVSIVTIARS